MFTILRDKNLYDLSPVKYKLIKIFINFCIKFLNLKSNFNVFLLPKKHKESMTLAAFNMDNNDIFCRVEGRFVYDICRSIAHELVHLKQKELDKFNPNTYTDIGGDIENEANAIAGIICKEFTKKYKASWIYKL